MPRLTGGTMEAYTRNLLRDVDDGSGIVTWSVADYLSFHNAAYHWWMSRFGVIASRQAALVFAAGNLSQSSALTGSINRIIRGQIFATGSPPGAPSPRKSVEDVVAKQIADPTQGVPNIWAAEKQSDTYGVWAFFLHPIPSGNYQLNVSYSASQDDIAAGTSPNVDDADCRTLCHIAASIMGPIMGRPNEYVQALMLPIPDAVRRALSQKKNWIRPDLEHYEELA